jgi:hypothetical protein
MSFPDEIESSQGQTRKIMGFDKKILPIGEYHKIQSESLSIHRPNTTFKKGIDWL